MAGSTDDPEAYRLRVAALFGTLTLPYDLGTVASFDYTDSTDDRCAIM
jgi:hypothetical protein